MAQVRQRIDAAVALLEPGGQLVEAQELTGGVSAHVYGLDIATATGARRRAVFRQHRFGNAKDHARNLTAMEYGVLAALHRQGLSVPEPYLIDHGGSATAPYLLTEWVDGSTEVTAPELPAAIEQMAAFLVALHSVDPLTLLVPELAPLEDPASAVVAYLPNDEHGDRVRSALAAGWRELEASDRPVLVHGDYWPGNMLWKHGRLVAVIDWEDACVGDPLADLATARVELLCQYGADAMERFTTRYEELCQRAGYPLMADRLPWWEVYLAGAALSKMHAWGLEPGEEARRRDLTRRFFDRAAGEL